MHFKNDNEMSSNANTTSNVIAHTKPILNGYATRATTAATGTNTSTSSSIGSCTSSASTDSGVIINDSKIPWNDNSSNNSNNSKTNNHTDNSDEEAPPRSPPQQSTTTRPQSLNFTNSINMSNKNDNNNINIENIINVTKTTQQNQLSNVVGGGTEVGNGVGISANGHRDRNNTSSSSKRCSPSVSIRSTTISIVSIDENACDSSIIDSDSDYEPDSEGVHGNYIVKKLGQQTTYEPDNPNLPQINKGMQVVSQTISPGIRPRGPDGLLPETILNAGSLGPGLGPAMTPSPPQIGSIALSNSTDVTFGDKHFYEGPVTIQQFLIDSRDKWKSKEGEHGEDNATFVYEREGKPGDEDATSKDNQNSSSQPNQPFKFIFNRKAVVITGTIIVLTILIGIVIVTTNVFSKQSIRKSKLLGDGDDSRKHIPINSTIEVLNDTEYVFNGTLLIISKDEWYAMPEREGVNKLVLPVTRVIISHTATTICETKHDCDTRVQSVQSFHMDSNQWSDIGYNFLVGGDGLVYEGRGWYNEGAHTKGYNKESIGISFVGTFNEQVPTENELLAAQLLIEEGVKLKVISPDYRLYGARQLGGTESPGKALFNIIKTWPHWTRYI